MKLASYKDGSRDGQLVVVSRDHSLALQAGGIVGRLQQLLDDWNFYAPQLQDLAHSLNHGKARHAFPFDPAMCLAPLPRIGRVVSAAAYPAALARQSRARGQDAPAAGIEAPLRVRSGDLGLGPRQALALRSVDAGLDFEAHWGLVTGAIAAEATPGQALDGVRLVGLVNAWSLRADAGGTAAGLELPLGWAPLLVTLDELGAAWQRGRLAARLVLRVNGAKVARLVAEDGQSVSAGELLARLARERPITAGTVLTLGPVGGAESTEGCASRLELLAEGGEPAWLAEGDTVELEAFDATGQSLFGALEQTVVRRD